MIGRVMAGERKCSVCDEPGPTDDHVPPLAFFPAEKDLPAYGDLRRNLITVPACDAHNKRFALDDEYVAIMVALSADAGKIGDDYFHKWKRALSRPGTRLKRYLESGMSYEPIAAKDAEMDFDPTAQLDRERYEDVMGRIARGLFFHETGRRLVAPLCIESPSLRPSTTALVVANPPRALGDLGAFPRRFAGSELVFSYRLRPDPFLLRMRFYENFNVYVATTVMQTLPE